MKLFRGIESFDGQASQGRVVTVGSFDGVHGGHQSLLSALTARATSLVQESLVVSFAPHPRVTLGRAEGLQLLSSDYEKGVLLEQCGVDGLLLLNFDEAFSRLTYEEFVVSYLIERVNMSGLVVGYNHHLGHNGGNSLNLESLAAQYGFELILASEYSCDGEDVSSSSIRHLLASGDVAGAVKLLGHPYLMVGRAAMCGGGAILFDEPLKLIPPAGQYRALVDGVEQRVVVDASQVVRCDGVVVSADRVEIEIFNTY